MKHVYVSHLGAAQGHFPVNGVFNCWENATKSWEATYSNTDGKVEFKNTDYVGRSAKEVYFNGSVVGCIVEWPLLESPDHL